MAGFRKRVRDGRKSVLGSGAVAGFTATAGHPTGAVGAVAHHVVFRSGGGTGGCARVNGGDDRRGMGENGSEADCACQPEGDAQNQQKADSEGRWWSKGEAVIHGYSSV
jgi:hypothetical protein